AARGAFEKLGDTRLLLQSFTLRNDGGWFLPVSRLNALRRDLTAGIEEALHEASAGRVQQALSDICPPAPPRPKAEPFRWSIKVDRIGFVDTFEEADWSGLDELIVDITRDHPAVLTENLDHWAARLGRQRIRLALPALTRKWE